MNFALSDIERDAIQCPYAGEQLDNFFELDECIAFTQAQAPPIFHINPLLFLKLFVWLAILYALKNEKASILYIRNTKYG